MLIGAHVSTAGGLEKAVARGIETGSTAIQIFNQSPRMWRPTNYSDDDFAAFREALSESPVEAVVIHAIYLINPGTFEPELHEKSLTALTHALRVGDGIGAAGVVLHPGPVMKGQVYQPTVANIVKTCAQALAESERCPLLLENAAGRNAVGSRFEQLADLIDGLDGDRRVGVCIDSCHAHAAGYDVSDIAGVDKTFDDLEQTVGLDRVGCLHVNDSRDEFASHRDRHANLGEGLIGEEGIAAFLSDPRLQDLPALLEVPGEGKNGPSEGDVKQAFALHARGLSRRS